MPRLPEMRSGFRDASDSTQRQVLLGMGNRNCVRAVTMGKNRMCSAELASVEVKAVLTAWELPQGLRAVLPTGRMPSAKAKAFSDDVEGVMT